MSLLMDFVWPVLLFMLRGIQVGQGFHYSRQENRSYSGELEFLLSSNNGLIVVNEITINEYLQGVLPGEMSSSFHPRSP